MEKQLMTCNFFNYIITTRAKAKEECRLLPQNGNCEACSYQGFHDFKELPDLIKRGYKSI